MSQTWLSSWLKLKPWKLRMPLQLQHQPPIQPLKLQLPIQPPLPAHLQHPAQFQLLTPNQLQALHPVIQVHSLSGSVLFWAANSWATTWPATHEEGQHLHPSPARHLSRMPNGTSSSTGASLRQENVCLIIDSRRGDVHVLDCMNRLLLQGLLPVVQKVCLPLPPPAHLTVPEGMALYPPQHQPPGQEFY